MIKKWNISALILFSITILFSCSDDGDTILSKSSLGFEYIPLKLGSEMIYQFDSIAYDEFTGGIDTVQFFVKETIEEEFIDIENNPSFLVGVYQRNSDTNQWVKKYNISKKLVGRKFEILENNQIRIPLVFPLGENVIWDPNALNANPEEVYSYKEIHKRSTVNGTTYDSVLVVDQKDELNLIERYLEEEKYAAQIGLIQKRKLALQTELNGTIRNGYDVRINLIERN